MKQDVYIGRTRGGKNTKIHALVNREGIPVCLSLSAGNRSDCHEAIPLLWQFGKIKGSNILGDRGVWGKEDSPLSYRAWRPIHAPSDQKPASSLEI